MRALAAALAAALGLALFAVPAVAETSAVTTAGLAFVPPEVIVAEGDGLVHANADVFEHNVTGADSGPDGQPLFQGDTIGTGQTAQVAGVEDLAPGSYSFYCSIHAGDMQGRLTVEAGGLPQPAPVVALVPVPGVFQLPVAMAQHPDSDDLYIVEKTGQVRAVRDGLVLDPEPVLDVSDEVSGGLEQGLLGLAFSPDGEHLYANLTDSGGDTHILEFAFVDGHVDLESRREVLAVEQPFNNHNGGTLLFGPDGYLYIGLGDGGSAGDPQYQAQRLDMILGKMLRIDPRPGLDAPYTVPADNPFAVAPGDEDAAVPEGALPEIWAYGLRNPWKYSFDRDTGDLWIGDVGQNRWEEVNVQRAASAGGENYGWNHMEGFELFVNRPEGAEEPDDHVPPIYVYPISGQLSCAVTGGYVYRGDAIAGLEGAYLFADWCDGRVRAIREVDGEVTEELDLGLVVPSIVSFAEDHDGELYAISLGGTVFKLVPAA